MLVKDVGDIVCFRIIFKCMLVEYIGDKNFFTNILLSPAYFTNITTAVFKTGFYNKISLILLCSSPLDQEALVFFQPPFILTFTPMKLAAIFPNDFSNIILAK